MYARLDRFMESVRSVCCMHSRVKLVDFASKQGYIVCEINE